MVYQQSLEIERRLDRVLRLVRTGRYSTPMLAEKIGVSIPTISRCVTALRARGYDIKAENHGSGWRYALMGKSTEGKGREQISKSLRAKSSDTDSMARMPAEFNQTQLPTTQDPENLQIKRHNSE
jgi:biotin operon repressor